MKSSHKARQSTQHVLSLVSRLKRAFDYTNAHVRSCHDIYKELFFQFDMLYIVIIKKKELLITKIV